MLNETKKGKSLLFNIKSIISIDVTKRKQKHPQTVL